MSTTIRCLPKGICCWDYSLSAEQFCGNVRLNTFNERGGISIGSVEFDVVKNGMLSGSWSLVDQGGEIVSAQKKSAFLRDFAIETPDQTMSLAPTGVLQRTFLLRSATETVAEFRPDHPLTRRAKIEVMTEDWESPVIVFSFWLVALMWRRATQNS